MALKVLMRKKELTEKQKALSELRKVSESFASREIDLEKAIEEASTDEETAAVEEAVEAFEKEKEENEKAIAETEEDIAGIEAEIAEIERSAPTGGEKRTNKKTAEIEKREGVALMNGRKFFGMVPEQRDSFLAREDVREFLQRTRELISEKRAVKGAELAIPDVMLELLRDNLHRYSKLISKIRLKTVSGKARQTIAGTVPEGVWVEMPGVLNELTMEFNQIEVDGYKVGGFMATPNSILEDSDINLASEIMDALGQAIGLAVDKAILYGVGTKMPLGIATRLAQTAEPSDWDANAPAWTDLHTSNILKLDPTGMTSEAFFAALILDLGVAEPNYATGGTIWCMNRKTRMRILSKAIAFNAAGALVAGLQGTMPVEGGEIIELPFIPDNDIIGGFASLYLLAERAGAQLAVSDQVRFTEDQTVFKGTARYDGKPARGEGFVIINIANSAATTAETFAKDYANTELGALAVTSVAGTNSGDTLITVTGAEVSGTTLGYKVLGKAAAVKSGDSNTGYTTFTTPDDITAATGKVVTVVEFDENGRAIKVGTASVVAKA